MAKTIKEMAEAAFPTIGENDKEALEALKYIGIECDNAHEYNNVRQNQQDLYIMGANAVLEKVLTYMESKPAHKGERFYNGLKDYIEQLKG